jgi:hypothetical protein
MPSLLQSTGSVHFWLAVLSTGVARVPLLWIVGMETLVARTIEPRSIYDARLTDEEIEERQRLRDLPAQ